MSTGLRNGAGNKFIYGQRCRMAALPAFLLALTRCYGYNNIMVISHNSRLTA